MASLPESFKISNSAAALVIFLAAYIAAFATVVVFLGKIEEVTRVIAWVGFSVLLFMTIIFFLSLLLHRTDIIDAAWGPSFVVAALTALIANPGGVSVGLNIQTLITGLVAIWALRLFVSIGTRLVRHPEDARYVELRKKWKGNQAINTYLRIFVVQAVLATIISGAVIMVNTSSKTEIGIFAVLGLTVWLVGFLFETVGDWQLKRFLAQPKNKGKLMTKGLWQYTRHPNYFGEATMWWGIWIIALSIPYGWLGVITPVIITYLLLFVSGVPLTEKAFARKTGWKVYQRRTSIFFPLPPRP